MGITATDQEIAVAAHACCQRMDNCASPVSFLSRSPAFQEWIIVSIPNTITENSVTHNLHAPPQHTLPTIRFRLQKLCSFVDSTSFQSDNDGTSWANCWLDSPVSVHTWSQTAIWSYAANEFVYAGQCSSYAGWRIWWPFMEVDWKICYSAMCFSETKTNKLGCGSSIKEISQWMYSGMGKKRIFRFMLCNVNGDYLSEGKQTTFFG